MSIVKLRNRHFFLLDLILLAGVPALALLLRDTPESWDTFLPEILAFTCLALAIKIPVFYSFGLYRQYWRYASANELIQIFGSVAVSTVILMTVFWSLRYTGILFAGGFPRSIPLLDGLLSILVVGATRFSIRIAEYWSDRTQAADNRRRVLIVGAGNSGAMIVRELRSSRRLHLVPVGFVDDDRNKQSMRILGVPVLGARAQLDTLIKTYAIDECIIAMPTAPGEVIRQVVRVCEARKIGYKTVPGMFELISGQVSVTRLRDVQIEDLLRREPKQVDMSAVSTQLAGRRVLVTGAGGSIGSELCRQILRARPAQLIMVGHGENSLFVLMTELRRIQAANPQLSGLQLHCVVADVRDRPRMDRVFLKCKPEIVFHAAAHKHVPLMESNPEDAITNNVLGTRNLVELSETHGVAQFVMVSSDKAVNPVSVMGVTKRVAEKIVTEAAHRSGRPFVCVRFGNVLGSRGSVVPLFLQQIANGGPVTVTHPEMTRYFMTIPEAVQLVLQAATLSHKGELFVLDMGQPVRISDLARDLIELSGYRVGLDIEITYSGLRPGEKLFEELFLETEKYQTTAHSSIFVANQDFVEREGGLAKGGGPEFWQQIDCLIEAASSGKSDDIQRWFKIIVPEYNRPDSDITAKVNQAVYDEWASNLPVLQPKT